MGDLIVQINVTFPTSLDPTLLAPLETILPPRPDLPTYPKEMHLDEDVNMVDAEDRRTRSGRDEMDEDEQEGAGGPNVQCANQ